MTRTGSQRKVDRDFWIGRLEQGRDYREAAEQAIALAEPGQNMNPALSHIVLAAIAYCDCLTATRKLVINSGDHGAATRLLRDAMQNLLPDAQENRLKRIVGKKDEVQYGVRPNLAHQATKMMEDLNEFAQWVEDVIARERTPLCPQCRAAPCICKTTRQKRDQALPH